MEPPGVSSESNPPPATGSWPDYRTVWRWHFYAGLFCIPFVIVLATSGAIYLFKPQIDAWNERAYDQLQFSAAPASAAEQIRAALVGRAGRRARAPTNCPPRPRPPLRVLVEKRRKGQSGCLFIPPRWKCWAPSRRPAVHPLAVPPARRIADGRSGLDDRRAGGLVDDRHDSDRLVPVVASAGARIGGNRLSSAAGWLADFLARRAQRHRRVDFGAGPVSLAQRLALGEVVGQLSQDRPPLTGTAVARQDWSTGSERAARGPLEANRANMRGMATRDGGAAGPCRRCPTI